VTLDPTFIYGNYVEACLWAALGILALCKRVDQRGVILGVTLVVFGVSDWVEAHTGAWYRPWWLLAWKAACVLVLLIVGIPLLRKRLLRRRAE